MKWYTVDEDYLNFLRSNEPRIPNADYGPEKFKPFFGALFELGDIVFITQVSHPQRRHQRMHENTDFCKLYNGNHLIAVVNLNYMFPVHKNRLIEVKYKNIDNFRTFVDNNERNQYITLLKKEMKQIKQKNISSKAYKLYNRKSSFPYDKVSKRCLDFKHLEILCNHFELESLKATAQNEAANLTD